MVSESYEVYSSQICCLWIYHVTFYWVVIRPLINV